MIIPRHAYSDDKVFEKELEKIFASRFFVGTSHDFPDKESYHSFRLGKHALTCRRDGDSLRVFNNVCLHRNALIDPPGNGKREFRCSYHGWRYGDDGQLLQTPLLEGGCIHNRQLEQHAVAESGGLHFVSLLGNAPDVSEVGELLQRHELNFSVAPFHGDTLEHDCNWKLLVENVLEGYHLSFVHGKTFGASGFSSQAKGDVGQGDYSLWSRGVPASSAALAALKHLPGAKAQYLHGYIFPGAFVANTNNLIGFVSYLLPQAVNKTQLAWQLFELPVLRRLPAGVREKIRQDAIATTRQILLEDKPVVELCQQGLSVRGPQPQWQPPEQQIQHFHEIYAQQLQCY